MTSPLLINEPPLQLLPTLAKKVGLNEAIVLQQIQYWLYVNQQRKSKQHFIDGRWWTYNTAEEWQEQFTFWSVETVRRALNSLRSKGIVLTGKHGQNGFDQTLWYTIDYDALNHLVNITKSISSQTGNFDLVNMTKSTDTEINTETNLDSENKKIPQTVLSFDNLIDKPYTELQDLCKSLGKDGHLVLVNYWYQLTGSKTPKLERNGLPTTIAKKLKVNYATFLKDKGFFEDVFPAMRDYALNIVPIKKDWATLEWFLGTGKDSKGPGWKRVAEKQAWLYRPDEGKNGTPNKPDVQPLYYTP